MHRDTDAPMDRAERELIFELMTDAERADMEMLRAQYIESERGQCP